MMLTQNAEIAARAAFAMGVLKVLRLSAHTDQEKAVVMAYEGLKEVLEMLGAAKGQTTLPKFEDSATPLPPDVKQGEWT